MRDLRRRTPRLAPPALPARCQEAGLDEVGVRRGFPRSDVGRSCGGNHSRSCSGSRRAAKTRCTPAFTTIEAESVRAIVAPSDLVERLGCGALTARAGVTRSV